MLAGLRFYKSTFSAVSVSAPQDLFEINAASAKPCWISRCELGQYSDAADAQDELLSLLWIQDHSTSGSGGASITPTPSGGVGAFSGTAERNNTTQATGGSPLTIGASSWNVRGGWIWAPDPTGWIFIPGGGRCVLAQTAPADAITMNGTIWLVEAG
jgi:hypothetical protein